MGNLRKSKINRTLRLRLPDGPRIFLQVSGCFLLAIERSMWYNRVCHDV